MFLRTSGSLFVSALFAMTASAQTAPTGAPSESTSSPDKLLSNWQADHGDSWHMATNPLTGTLEMLYGGNAQSPFEPNSTEPADWYALGRFWINQTHSMHLVDGAELVEARFRYLPLGQVNSTDKITVRFEQVIAGVPVEGAAINVLFDTSGRLLSIHTTAAPEVESPGARSTIGAGFANLVAAQAFSGEFGVTPSTQGSERLVHAFVDDGETRRWALAWQVEANYDGLDSEPIGRKYTIDAATGAILKSVSTVHNFDVTGTIRSNATPGLTADRAANPPVPIEMPRVRVSSSAGTVETDRDGNFTFPGVNTPLDITVDYFGEFTNVDNDAGAEYSVTFPAVAPNQQNDLLMNPSPTQQITAQANAQLHINVLRDWIVDRFPMDDTADFRATANVNINSNCNAFFNGNSVNFYVQGGGCNNTAFSTVVAHEMGHWLNVLYGTGNGSDGMGEGNADVFAMYLYDDPIVGRFFSTGGGSVRTGTNTRQFCGDANPGCYGAVHTDGQVWMGAAWKVREELNASLGNAMGDMVADSLFLGWMNSFNQTGIRSIIETQWLTLDDDDGNINNGTPNYPAIDAGFRIQGFPGFDLPFITLANVTEIPDQATPLADYIVDAEAFTNLGTSLSTVELLSRSDTGAFVSDLMANVGGTNFRGTITGGINPAIVQYYVRATDDQGNIELFPDGGETNPLFFRVGNITPVLVTDFEAGSAGFTSGAGGDTATTGIWEIGNPVGTAAQPENDNTPGGGTDCWFTGQGTTGGGLGANDVDGGRTTLLSPVFDASGAAGISLSYARWYSNDQGGSPNADVFRVDVSTNGGGSWTNVETVGPAGPETEGGWINANVELSFFVTPSANMQVRFVAEDAGTGSIVEAAIDDIEITVLDGVQQPSNYCIANLNSTGLPGVMSSAGSTSISANNLVLFANNLPTFSFGLFFFGDAQTQVPINFSEGNLCVTGTTLRLPPVQSDAFGGSFFLLDYTDSGSNASMIMSGSTWNFQHWFRDFVNGSVTSNTTDGLEVQFID